MEGAKPTSESVQASDNGPTSHHGAVLGRDYLRRGKNDPQRDATCVRSVARALIAGEGPDQRYLGENLTRVVEEQLYKFVSGFETGPSAAPIH